MTLTATRIPHYSKRRIKFILSYSSAFRGGNIPQDEPENGRESGYGETDPFTRVQKSIKAMAQFVPASDMIAEAEIRCRRAMTCIKPTRYDCNLTCPDCAHWGRPCKFRQDDGMLVLKVYRDNPDTDAQEAKAKDLAEILQLSPGEFWHRLNRALSYASSDNCLLMSYKAWRGENHK